MRLDRKLVKEQAKQLIRNNIWKLLLVSVVVSLLVGSGGFATGFNNGFSDGYNNGGESYDDFDDAVDDWFEGFGFDVDDDIESYDNGGNDGDTFNPDQFEDFTGKISVIPTATFKTLNNPFGLNNFSFNLSFISIVLAPLTVTLWGVYLSLIKGKCMEVGESFSYVFSNTFNKSYGKKLGLVVLMWLFTFLWSLLFLIPGIVYHYKVKFAPMIMEEHPELSPKEAMELSKKMTQDHKGELFALDLSFIGWDILVAITFGLAGIYYTPYKNTVDALYYANFKARCEQEGRILPDDYMSFSQKVNAYGYQNPQQEPQNYYQPAEPQETSYYQPPVDNEQNYYQPNTPPAPEPTNDDFGSHMDSDYYNNQNF